MIGNIRDHRTDRSLPDCDAVFEPSAHDQARRADGTEVFSYDEATSAADYFLVDGRDGITVREAVLHADTAWSFPVTVFLYDRGIRPLG